MTNDNIFLINVNYFLLCIITMLTKNVLNPNKKNKLSGNVFHIFYPNMNESVLFDNDMSECIIHGSKNIVMTHVKKLDELMGVVPTTKVRIYSYILAQEGYRKIDMYNGPIETIGKYIRRY